MRNKQRIAQRCRLSALLAVCLLLALPPAPRAIAQESLADRDATALLRQISEGLGAHNAAKMLGAFDLAQMKNGAVFRQDILSFFDQTGTIRVHFNLLRTANEGGRGVAEANVELEADMLDDGLPPVHKQAQLHLVCEKTSGGWRITEIIPRDFFSIQP